MSTTPMNISKLSKTIAHHQAQPAILSGLILLMITTRGQIFASAVPLPSASVAIFFMAGCYIRPVFALVALIGTAGFLDMAAVFWGGVNIDCFGPSYPFLAVAYAVLWLGGRWFANQYQPNANTLLPLAASVLISSLICSLISNGSYYLLSGSFTNPSFAEFGARMVEYYPSSLQAMALYIAVAAIITVSAAHYGEARQPEAVNHKLISIRTTSERS